ncbi:MAG: sigma-70 family RNA polymerase sigma factor [Planctomycetota bacterium]
MTELPQTRHSLLIRLRERSDEAWQEFLSIYEQSIFEFAQRKGLQEADARDVTQEVLSALERKIPEWDLNPQQGKLRGWLFRVARNLAVDKIIERSKSPQELQSDGSSGIQDFSEGHSAESQEFSLQYRRQLLHWAAEQVRSCVNETTWKAFWMTAIEGKSSTHVAQQLNLTHGNVYAAKFRVTARIQKLVQSMGGVDERDWPVWKDKE